LRVKLGARKEGRIFPQTGEVGKTRNGSSKERRGGESKAQPTKKKKKKVRGRDLAGQPGHATGEEKRD